MKQIIKDLISFFIYLLIVPFYKNKNVILVYHSIETIEVNEDPLKMNVTPGLFAKQIAYLSKKKDRYTLTFDDGFESVYINAFPLLKKYGMKSILFLTTDYIDGKIRFDHFFENRYSPRPLKWKEVKEMHSYGVGLGSHGLTHKKMADLSKDMMREEAIRSRSRIEDMVGCRVESFSYPIGSKGSFSDETDNLLKSLDYRRSYINIMGRDNSQTEPFRINRIRVYGDDNMLRFRMKAAGAYNWVDQLMGVSGKENFSIDNY